MHLTRRGKRRLIVLALVILAVAVGVFVFTQVRHYQHDRSLTETRAAALAAYEAGNLDDALQKFSIYFGNIKDDLEVNLAFADARFRVPTEKSQHVLEALDLYRNRCLLLIDSQPDLPNRDAQRMIVLKRLLEIHQMLGMGFEMVQTSEQILQQEPDSVDALSAQTLGYYLRREFDLALAPVQRLVELEPENLAWCQLQLEVMRKQGATDEQLIEQCDQWCSQYVGDGRFHVLKAMYLAQLGRVEETQRELTEAVSRGINTLSILQQTVALLDRMKLPDLASQALADARAQFPDEQWVRQATVRRLWHAGRLSEALEEIEAAQKKFPALDPGLLRYHIMLLIANQRNEEAFAVLELLRAQADPEEDESEANLAWADAIEARIKLTPETWQATLQLILHARNQQPNDASLYFMLGETYQQVREDALALKYFKQAYQIEPDWIAAAATYTEALLTMRRSEEAYLVAGQLLNRTQHEGRLPILIQYARAYLALLYDGGNPAISDRSTGQVRDLASILAPVYTQFPQDAQLAGLLAEVYFATNRRDEAKALTRNVLDDPESTPDVLLTLAELSLRFQLGEELALTQRAAEQSELTPRAAVIQAYSLAEQSKSEEGLALLDQALSAQPESGQTAHWQQQRVAYLLTSDHEDASTALHNLVAQFPESLPVLTFTLGQSETWEDQEFVAEVIDHLRKYLGNDAHQVKLAHANQVIRFLAEDEAQLAHANILINDVLKQAPQSLAALSLMAEISLMGQYPSPERAIENLETAVAIYPGQTSLYLRLIHLLQEQGQFDKAGRYLDILSQFAQSDPELRRASVALLQTQGDLEEALLHAAGLITEEASESEQLALAAMHVKANQLPEAERIYTRLLSQEGHTRLTVAQTAEFYARTGRFDEGTMLIQEHDLAGGDLDRAVLLGHYYQRHGQLTQAEQWFKQAVEAYPDSLEARHHLARFYIDNQNPERAKQEAQAGLELDPEHHGLQATLASACFTLGESDRKRGVELLSNLDQDNEDLQAVIQLFSEILIVDNRAEPTDEQLQQARQLVKQHASFLHAWQLAISLHHDAGRVSDAIDLARQALTRFPTEPEPSQWTTRLLMRAERWDEALVEALEWRRRTRGDTFVVDLDLASLYLRLNQPLDALAQLERHESRFTIQDNVPPTGLVAWLEALLANGQCRRAAEYIDVLVTDYPDQSLSFAIEFNRAAQRTDRGECYELADQYAQLASQIPDLQVIATVLRGTIAEAQQQASQAAVYYRRALEWDPDQPQALNNLAFVLTKTTDEHEEALSFIQHALQQYPDQPDFLDTYALVLSNLNRHDQAIEAYQQALSLRPDDVNIAMNLVDLLLAQQDYEAADSTLQSVHEILGQTSDANNRYLIRADELSQQLAQSRAEVDS